MKELNDLNWQCLLIHVSVKKPEKVEKPLPDYESIQINLELVEIKNDPKHSKSLQQPTIRLHVNLYSCTVTNKHGEVKMVALSKLNVRMLRKRPESNKKNSGIILFLSTVFESNEKEDFAKERGAYGKAWGRKVKKD